MRNLWYFNSGKWKTAATFSSFKMANLQRPDKGGALGRKATVQVNIFPITALNELSAYHYDVVMNPELPAPISRHVFRQLELKIKEKHPKVFFVFDGLKNAFSTSNIDDVMFDIYANKEVEITIPPMPQQSQQGGGDRGGRGRGRGGPRGGGAGFQQPVKAPSLTLTAARIIPAGTKNTEKVQVTMKRVTSINVGRLLQFAQGKCSEDDSVLQAYQCLQVALRHVPSLLFVPVQSNFFTPEGRTPISGGLEIWRGYHQSVRAMMAGHLGINIDLASTVFRAGGISLIDYIIKVVGCRGPSEISSIKFDVLNKALKGINVTTTHRGDAKQRFKLSKLSKDTANTCKFEGKDKKMISVAQYFEREYNYRLKFPNLPLALKANGKTAFPIECLEIQPAQKFRARLNPDQTADMIKVTTQKPHERKKRIEDAVNVTLKYEKNEYLNSFGLQIGKEMMSVESRVIPAPKVKFKTNDFSGESGAWNLKGAKVIFH
jgi:eukaryotic translation initiation factor 2C